jgi:hypothetical protein
MMYQCITIIKLLHLLVYGKNFDTLENQSNFFFCSLHWWEICGISNRLTIFGQLSSREKSRTVLASYSHILPNNVLIDQQFDPVLIRKFSVAELERLQGLEGWVDCVPNISYAAKVKCLGNAINGDVASYIFHELKIKMNK